MSIIKSLKDINLDCETVITIGKFDGIHIGHHNIINKTISVAKNENKKSALFTFQNHPNNYFYPNSVKSLISEEDKYKHLLNMGVDIIVSIPFDDYMTSISPLEYIENILVKKLNVKNIIIGHDFRFGKERMADALVLKDYGKVYGFDVDIIRPIKINDIRISSTYIRNLITSGNVGLARTFLGRLYGFKGTVVHGNKLGRELGFPTVNLKIDNSLLVPKNGVYYSKVKVGDKFYEGATNVGNKPTVQEQGFSIETHILDYDGDLYGEQVRVYFMQRLRDEKKFKNVYELKNQLDVDLKKIRYKNMFTYDL